MLVSSMYSDRGMHLVLFAEGTAPLEMLFAEELDLGKELFLLTVLCHSNVKVFA